MIEPITVFLPIKDDTCSLKRIQEKSLYCFTADELRELAQDAYDCGYIDGDEHAGFNRDEYIKSLGL